MQVMTNREYETWMAWFEEEWQHPDCTDQYLMQIACEVRRVLAKSPSSIKIQDFRLPFEKVKADQKQKPGRGPQAPMNQRDRQDAKTKANISKWIGWLGMAPRVINAV